MLPHLQSLRLVERRAAAQQVPDPPAKVNKAVDATPQVVSRGMSAVVRTAEAEIQFAPSTLSRFVEAKPAHFSVSVEAIPTVKEQEIDAVPPVFEQSVDATPSVFSQGINAIVETAAKYVDASIYPELKTADTLQRTYYPRLYVPPVVSGAVSLAWKAMVFGPNLMTSRLHDIWSLTPFRVYAHKNEPAREKLANGAAETEKEKVGMSKLNGTSNGDISPVCI